MKSLTLSFLVALLLALAVAETTVSKGAPADILKDPMYASLKAPKGEEITKIEPQGKDTILEELADQVVSDKAIGEEKKVSEKAEMVPADDHVNPPASHIAVDETTKQTDALDAVSDHGYYGRRRRRRSKCSGKCYKGHGYCPKKCYSKACYYTKKVKYAIKYKKLVKVPKKVYRRVRYTTKYCKKYWTGYHWGCHYQYHYYYKWVIGYVYKYKYVYYYKYVYKYKYYKGYKCVGGYGHY